MNQHWLLSRAEPNCVLVLCRPMKVAETPQQRTWALLKRASGHGGGTVVWMVLAPPAVTGRAQNRKPALERKLCALENSWWANHFQQMWWRSPEMSGCLSLSGKRKGRNFGHGKKLTPELQQTASTSLIRFSQVLSAFSLMMSSLCAAISSFPLTSHPR